LSQKQVLLVFWIILVLLSCLSYYATETWQEVFFIFYAILVCATGMMGARATSLIFAGLGCLVAGGYHVSAAFPKGIIHALFQGIFLVLCFILGWGYYKFRNLAAQHKSLGKDYTRALQNFETLKEEVNYLHFAAVNSLAAVLEARDEGTLGHTERVALYAVALARELGLTSKELSEIYYASVLHDLGKIGISEAILNKPEKLSGEEFMEVRKHPEVGIEILQSMTFMQNLFPLILHHHEYYDGTGYPRGLARDQIPLGARIIAIADAYDAMTSDRPYRPAFSRAEAAAELRRCTGSQFDPRLVGEFLAILKRERLEDVQKDFSPLQVSPNDFSPIIH